MFDEHENTSARRQGWMLVDVFDARTQRARPEILPVTFARPFDSARKTAAWVIERAKSGDALAQKALQLVMQGLK
jgi:hypothetical protein